MDKATILSKKRNSGKTSQKHSPNKDLNKCKNH